VPPSASVTLGVGRAVQRAAVVVKVTTDEGIAGWGESTRRGPSSPPATAR
jgi:D-galactarolactone cycloisomerase